MKPNLPILLMNADEVYFTENKTFLQKALDAHIANNNLATVVVIEHPEAGKKFGALWCDKNEVKNISKTANHENLKPWHCIGPIFVSWDVLKLIPENNDASTVIATITLPMLRPARKYSLMFRCPLMSKDPMVTDAAM